VPFGSTAQRARGWDPGRGRAGARRRLQAAARGLLRSVAAMALPPALVGALFLIAVVSALACMAYMVWSTSKPSDFFSEAVSDEYEMELAEEEINQYYTLKDKLQEEFAPEAFAAAQSGEEPEPVSLEGMDPRQAAMATMPWTVKVPAEHRTNLQKALLIRLVACIDKLDQVQRDKPGNWKLWQTKLISERFWETLVDAEKMVSAEIESCICEAEELQPGWREHIFMQAVQHWRLKKQQETEKKETKRAVEQVKSEEKKAVKDEIQKVLVDRRKEIEEKVRQERLAQKMMEKLLAEEEAQAAKAKKAGKEAPKSKSKKK